MTWPVDDITTESVDSNTDRPNRGHFFTLFRRGKRGYRRARRSG